ncbi:hypothetical protein ABMA27_016005 [Loxostege sticticalis]|uniref:Uncharacterized protein n=1 Tax=Loxostege sticticalis TaxID=481309 RepID=A0ABR3I552_LOXSC
MKVLFGIVLPTLPPDTRPEHCRNIPLKHGCVCPTDFNPVGLNGCQFGNICDARATSARVITK